MPRVELDTFLITLFVPKGLPVGKILKVLNRKRFQHQLQRAMELVLSQHFELKPLTITLTR